MSKVIAVSGPSATGKSTIVSDLGERLRKESLSLKVVPDIYEVVWKNLVDRKMFTEFTDIIKDGEYLCVFIYNLLEEYARSLEDKNVYDVVLLDGCWLDIFIYSNINLWYNHAIKDIQFDILNKLTKYKDSVDRIYITKDDSTVSRNPSSYTSPFRSYNVKFNRPLELQYYSLSSKLGHAVEINPFNPVDTIFNDLKGYLL